VLEVPVYRFVRKCFHILRAFVFPFHFGRSLFTLVFSINFDVEIVTRITYSERLMYIIQMTVTTDAWQK